MATAEGRKAERWEKEVDRLEAEGQSRAGSAAWREYIARPIPPDIDRDMRAYLAGHFEGEDRSPLAYVGYRVGKSNGLMLRERHRRLQVCFRIEIPRELRDPYAAWGPPASPTRLTSMCCHLGMLADMRSTRPNFEQAVSEWNGDKAWLREEFSQTSAPPRRIS